MWSFFKKLIFSEWFSILKMDYFYDSELDDVYNGHYVWSTQVKWPSGEEALFWSVQLDSLGLWLADKIGCLVCRIKIQLNPAEQTKSAPLHWKAI